MMLGNVRRLILLCHDYGADQVVICILVCLGVVKSKRSIWRLKTITDFFWAIVNLIGVFFATMFSVRIRVVLFSAL